MSIVLKQFNGSNVTPTDDAVLYEHFEPQSGILSGMAVTSLGANQLQIASGRGLIKGRSFVVEQETILANLPTSGNVPGRLLIQIDLSNTETPISFITQAAASLPDLVQEDINSDGSVYQMVLATYTASPTQIADLSVVNNSFKPYVTNENIVAAVMAARPKVVTVTVGTSWAGSGPYTQNVNVPGANASSKVDLQPDAAILQGMMDLGVSALFITNNNGVFTLTALGSAPTVGFSLQATVEEVAQ